MTNFLFWNINRKPLENLIVDACIDHEVDVLILAESTIHPEIMLQALNAAKTQYHYAPGIGCRKIHIFTRFPGRLIAPILETHRLTIRQLRLPRQQDVLVAAIHFQSKRHSDDASQAVESINLSDAIRKVEGQVGHTRTILVGDLNMNPFEDGLVTARGLHAVMSRDVARRGERTVQRETYRFFYNPMWSLFGDLSAGPPGTYYYDNSQQKVLFWNIFDQVLIRAELIDQFDIHQLKIVDTIGNTSLLSQQGIPDVSLASDHLPLAFSLKFQRKDDYGE